MSIIFCKFFKRLQKRNKRQTDKKKPCKLNANTECIQMTNISGHPGERTKPHWDKTPLGQNPTGQNPTGQNPTAIFGREDKTPLLHKKG